MCTNPVLFDKWNEQCSCISINAFTGERALVSVWLSSRTFRFHIFAVFGCSVLIEIGSNFMDYFSLNLSSHPINEGISSCLFYCSGYSHFDYKSYTVEATLSWYETMSARGTLFKNMIIVRLYCLLGVARISEFNENKGCAEKYIFGIFA